MRKQDRISQPAGGSDMKGITVILYTDKVTGQNKLGEDIVESTAEEISDVLVSPSTSDEIVTTQSLYGKMATYTLAIPKTDTHDWTDRTVEFFGKKWRTVGFPTKGIDANIPGPWNTKVVVSRYE